MIFPIGTSNLHVISVAIVALFVASTGTVQAQINGNYANAAVVFYGNTSIFNSGNITNASGGDVATISYEGPGQAILINDGSIVATGLAFDPNAPGGALSVNSGTIDLNNSGLVAGAQVGIRILGGTTTLTNSGSIETTDTGTFASNAGIWMSAGSLSLENSGTITGRDGGGVYLRAGNAVITSLHNSGTISSVNGHAINVGVSTARIIEIINTGTISAGPGKFGISYDSGASPMTLLANSQDGLTYTGKLPTNYNIIIDWNGFGRLAATAVTGTVNFGIQSGSYVSAKEYSDVLTGVAAAKLGNISGTYLGNAWMLRETATGSNRWKLVFPDYKTLHESAVALNNAEGMDAADIIDANAQLAGLFTQQTTVEMRSKAISQTFPLLAGAHTQLLQSIVKQTGGIVQSRLDSVRGVASGDELLQDKYAWIKPVFGRVDHDGSDGVGGFQARINGVVIGTDGEVHPGLRVGSAVSITGGRVDGSSGGASHVLNTQLYQLVAYCSYALEPDTHANVLMDVGRQFNTGDRAIDFNNATAHSNFSSNVFHVGTSVGRSLAAQTGHTVFTSAVGLDYTAVQDAAYEETGANNLNLRVAKRITESLVVGLNGKLHHRLSDDLRVSTGTGIGYDLVNSSNRVDAAYVGAPSMNFATESASPNPWIFTAGVGIQKQVKTGYSVNARYDVQLRGRLLNQMGSLNLNWLF